MITRDQFFSTASQVEAGFPPRLTDRSRGYTSFQGGMRLYRRLSRLDTAAELTHVIGSLTRLGHLPCFDKYLVLAIAFRESGSLVLSSRTSTVDSFHQGGLDRLYAEAPRLAREGVLPADVRTRLRAGSTAETEGSTVTRRRHAAAATIERRDLLVAYGAVVNDRFQRMRERATALGLDTAGLSGRARRLWTALFFGGPGGLPYDEFAAQRDRRAGVSGWMGSHFGATTVMTFLRSQQLPLGGIERLDRHEPRLYDTTRVMSAFVVTAEAETMDRLDALVRVL